MNDAPADNVNDTTQIPMDWKSILPKDVQQWEEVTASDSAEKFFDQMSHMRKRMGQSIRVPTKDAGQEQMEEFYKSLESRVPGLMRTPNPEDADSMAVAMRMLGQPESQDGYTLGEGLEASEAEIADLRALAQNVGMTKTQFRKFSEGMLGANKMSLEQAQQAIQSEQDSIKNEWGAATDERYADILNIAEATGASEGLINSIKNKSIDASAAKWLYQLGKQLGGEAVNAHIEQKSLSPMEASESIDDILNNKDHPYWHNAHPDHDKAVKKVIELNRLAAAGG